ncbi:MAG: hypothetical protein KGL18_17115 [Burkholderiales bacterium]|nr:hypothetical protein [Burkholderiales bacterium]MDE1928221.1 hypothetical protein [Burkholderiales bacterium]MDE2504688.1 hypothetical protein [Burkholderiales bacterium]
MPGPDGQIPAESWNLPYALAQFRMRFYRVPALAPTSSWRSVGASPAGLFALGFPDVRMHVAGAVPPRERLRLRLRLHLRLRLLREPVARRVCAAVGAMSIGNGVGVGPDAAAVSPSSNRSASLAPRSSKRGGARRSEQGMRIGRGRVALDGGRLVDPVNFDDPFQGAVVRALGQAMNCEITEADGKSRQSNSHVYPGLRLYRCPEIWVRGLEQGTPVRGTGAGECDLRRHVHRFAGDAVLEADRLRLNARRLEPAPGR